MTANPYIIEPSHRAPRSKAAVLLGRRIEATAWIERGQVLVKLDWPGMQTPAALRNIADAVDGWANGG